MDSDIVQRLKAEEADLARKLEAVRAVLAAYGGSEVATVLAERRVERRSGGSRPKVEIDGFGAYGRKVVAEALRMMATSNHPLKTRQLVEPIEAMGVEITGENKINALGALLARSVDVISHGKAGWSVADREKAFRIVAEHGQKENEPSSNDAVGSDAVRESAPTLELTEAHSY